MIKFTVYRDKTISFQPKQLFCLAEAGRIEKNNEAHAEEMLLNGIPSAAESKPEFKPVSAILLTQDANIDVLGSKTAGEVEFVLFMAEDKMYVTVGADHADRVLEALQSSFSKQVCAKPIAAHAWPLAEVLPHWDTLKMRSEVLRFGEWTVYQEGSVDFLMHPSQLLEIIRSRGLPLENGCVYFCGTILMIESNLQFGDAYRIELSDPVTNRRIEHSYAVTVLKNDVNYIKIS